MEELLSAPCRLALHLLLLGNATMTDLFPVSRIDEIQNNPSNFRLLERVPLTLPDVIFPVEYNSRSEDDITLVILDVETTGLDAVEDDIIELGLVEIKYSRRHRCLVSVDRVISLYNEPRNPIPPEITTLTGITDDMVKGHKILEEDLIPWFGKDPYTIAHNASFDRKFFDRAFPGFSNLRWSCTIDQIDWKSRGISTRALEGILLSLGFFYDGHRAATDCLAVAQALYSTEGALREVLLAANKTSSTVFATGSPFKVKDTLKARGYRWGGGPDWSKNIPTIEVGNEKVFLDELYFGGGAKARVEELGARGMFK